MIQLLNPFACAFCEDSFPISNALVNHVKIKHETIKVKIENDNCKNKVQKHMVAEEEKASEDNNQYDTSTNEKLERSLSLIKVNNKIENSVRASINAEIKLKYDCESIIVDQTQSTFYSDIELDIKKDLMTSKIDEEEFNQQSKTYNVRATCRDLERSHRERKYSCSLCQKKYYYKQQLKIHERVHTGEKPYSCRFCDKKFSQSKTIPYHER